MAVEHIVNAQNRPNPFLLIGPPGTGKTRTLVSAIQEIVRSSNKSVLVCAFSNSACDEISERLLDVLSAEEIHRLYAKTFNTELISPKIWPISNIQDGKIQMPSLKYLQQFRVVVCTMLTAGSIVRARGEEKCFSSTHFSHIIMDEAAYCPETVSLVPIAGMCQFFLYSIFILLTPGSMT